MIRSLRNIPVTATIRKAWNEQPLPLIMTLAVVFRMLAAIFARGWGMLDDHFLVIEAPQSWVFGYDYNNWLPSSKGNTGPSGHNFFYPGLHYLLFLLMKWTSLDDPQYKMLIVRILHAGWSLVTVWAGYRITETLSERRAARLAGILLALYFFMPWISVRNLAEVACIPFIMLAFWRLVKPGKESPGFGAALAAGAFLGLAMDFRYQVALFPAGVAIVFLLRRQWSEVAGVTAGVFLTFFVVQSMIDLAIWGYPFAEMAGYIRVNVVDRNSYFNLPWYNYFLTVGGLLIPPVSLFLFYGFFRGWKKHLLLFLPALFFFAFHSYFPNKQERFILPFIPVFIVLGSAGYYRYMGDNASRPGWRAFIRGSWIFFWTLNIIGLAGVTFMYSKKSRVEAMYYLYNYPYVKNIILEDGHGNAPLLPKFYTGRWPSYPETFGGDTTFALHVRTLSTKPRFHHPQFYLFTGEKDLDLRISRARESFPGLVYDTTIRAGFIDQVMHFLNPVNQAEQIYIYRNTEFYREKIE